MKSSHFFLFALLFSLLICLPFSSAVGVSPASYKIDFEPNQDHTFTFTVRNNVGHDIIVTATPSGALAQYATIEGNNFPLKVDERGDFNVHLELPDYIDTPGRNQLKIYVTEQTVGSGISAKTGVIPIIFVQVPYPGHYAIIESFKVAEGSGGVNEGEDTPVTFTIWNQGLEELRNTRADLTLFDAQGNQLETKTFTGITMSPNARYAQSVEFATKDLPPSDYSATLNYYYDDVTRTEDKLLRVGNFDVKLVNYTAVVEKKGIVPFTLEVENRWKGKIFVTSTLAVEGAAPMETPRKGLEYFKRAELTAYLDTTNLELGNHTASVSLFFEKENPIAGDAPQTKIVPIQFALVEPANVKGERPAFFASTSFVLFAAMLFLLIMAAVLVVVLLRQKKKKK